MIFPHSRWHICTTEHRQSLLAFAVPVKSGYQSGRVYMTLGLSTGLFSAPAPPKKAADALIRLRPREPLPPGTAYRLQSDGPYPTDNHRSCQTTGKHRSNRRAAHMRPALSPSKRALRPVPFDQPIVERLQILLRVKMDHQPPSLARAEELYPGAHRLTELPLESLCFGRSADAPGLFNS